MNAGSAEDKETASERIERRRRRHRTLGDRRQIFVLILLLLTAAVGPNLLAQGISDLLSHPARIAARWCLLFSLLLPIGVAFFIYETWLCRRRSATEQNGPAGVPDTLLWSLAIGACLLTAISLIECVAIAASHARMYFGALEIVLGSALFMVAAGATVILGQGLLRANVVQKTQSAVATRRALVTFLSAQRNPHRVKEVESKKKPLVLAPASFSSGAATEAITNAFILKYWSLLIDEQKEKEPKSALKKLESLLNADLPENDDNGESVPRGKPFEAVANADFSRSNFKWQQALRALYRHIKPRPDRFRSSQSGEPRFLLLVIPSEESRDEVGEFKAMVGRYLEKSGFDPSCVEIIDQGACDFENLQQVLNALETAIFTLQERQKDLQLSDITIDTTGGQKIVSIAAAGITFQSGLEFSYVSTNSPWEVRVVDMRIALNPQG